MKLVRALRKGWIQTTEQRKVTREEPAAYLLWADDGVASEKIANGEQTVVPAPTELGKGSHQQICLTARLWW